jgi:sugar lactone lactonase YvrE
MTPVRWDEIPDDGETVTVDVSEMLAQTPTTVAHRVEEHRSELGEHPAAVGEQTVVWVDINRGEVRRSHASCGLAECLYRSPRPVGFALPVTGSLPVLCQNSFAGADLTFRAR